MPSQIYQQIRRDLLTAMTERDMVAVSALRTAVAAIDNAGAVEVDLSGPAMAPSVGFSRDVPRRELDERAVTRILEAEIDERRTAIETFARLGQSGHVERLEREVEVLARYVPEDG